MLYGLWDVLIVVSIYFLTFSLFQRKCLCISSVRDILRWVSYTENQNPGRSSVMDNYLHMIMQCAILSMVILGNNETISTKILNKSGLYLGSFSPHDKYLQNVNIYLNRILAIKH